MKKRGSLIIIVAVSKKTTSLAKKITKESSIQTYYTMHLLADKGLTDNCFKGYAYFRWIDDQIDIDIHSPKTRVGFINRQKKIINDSYEGKVIKGLSPEEKIITELISSDTVKNSKLKSFIINFFKIIEFDAYRRGKDITGKKLDWYSVTLGQAVTDCLQHFIGNKAQYPESKDRCKAAIAAHITHMLRDLREDIVNGYVNIPIEYLKKYRLNLDDIYADAFINFVKERVKVARKYFKLGKKYIDTLPVLRCKIAGYWYHARFERILKIIERDNYILREDYSRGRSLDNYANLAWLTVEVSWRHFAKK